MRRLPSRNLFPLLGHFQQLRPELSILHVERSCLQQADELRAQLIDVGFGLFPVIAPDLSIEPLWEHPAYMVLPSGHPLGQEAEIDPEHVKHSRIGLIEKEPAWTG
jgi:DNA-binding transcriptional LysR family regulator